MKINTGNGFIPLIAMAGIWSVSALTALPGLAVSPILGDLTNIFPKASQMEIQMLTSLPSLLILPLILLSGYLSQKVNFYKLLISGLIFFAVAGVLYLLCNKMWQLVVVSAFLGIGAGLIIPLSTGLISIFFYREVRVRQFGYSSAISNIMVVLATFVTGYLATINWKLPFLVYLLPFISIILVIPLKKYWPRECADNQKDTLLPDNVSIDIPKPPNSTPHIDFITIGKYGFDIRNLIKLMAFYGIITFIVVSIIFYLPFLVKSYGMSEEDSGNMISLFFLAMMLPGFF
jgi:Cyanate permease